jgi:hypothetical protein
MKKSAFPTCMSTVQPPFMRSVLDFLVEFSKDSKFIFTPTTYEV